MDTYDKRKQANIKLSHIRELYQKALEEYKDNSIDFYEELAACLRTVKGKENAKPASYFANLLEPLDEAERHSIATTVGACGMVADADDRMKQWNGTPSSGIVSFYLPDLHRSVQTVPRYYAEVDENGNVIGPVHKHAHHQYVYYTE